MISRSSAQTIQGRIRMYKTAHSKQAFNFLNKGYRFGKICMEYRQRLNRQCRDSNDDIDI